MRATTHLTFKARQIKNPASRIGYSTYILQPTPSTTPSPTPTPTVTPPTTPTITPSQFYNILKSLNNENLYTISNDILTTIK